MKNRTRILNAKHLKFLLLVVILAALAPLSLHTVRVTDAQTPISAVADAPALRAVSAGANAVNLSWNAVSDAVRYELWTWTSATGWQQLDERSPDSPLLYPPRCDGRKEILLHRRRTGQQRRARPVVGAG